MNTAQPSALAKLQQAKEETKKRDALAAKSELLEKKLKEVNEKYDSLRSNYSQLLTSFD